MQAGGTEYGRFGLVYGPNRYIGSDAPTPPVVALVDHADPVGAFAEWASTTLIVPPGHPRSGEPLALLDFAVDWLRESWTTHESALSTARKNAKSAIAAVLALGYLVGPLRRSGWRGAIASISKEKASELRRQVREIAEASGAGRPNSSVTKQANTASTPRGALPLSRTTRTTRRERGSLLEGEGHRPALLGPRNTPGREGGVKKRARQLGGGG